MEEEHQQDVPKLVKGTFYLREEDMLALEEVRLSRRRKGEKTDKSALVREAIGLLKALEEVRSR